MLIVLTAEDFVEREGELLNRFFAEGLEVLHIRKPNWTKNQHRELLEQIDQQYHSKIVLHHEHSLFREFDIKGLHFTERKRKKLGPNFDKKVKYYKENKGLAVSTAFHKLADLNPCKASLDYCFLSPVFTSISKPNYKGKGFVLQAPKQKIIGLGGMSEDNIADALTMGYWGVAVLGAVWNSDRPLDRFREIQRVYKHANKKEGDA